MMMPSIAISVVDGSVNSINRIYIPSVSESICKMNANRSNLTAKQKAEKSSIAWADKGDPYSCLDFRILLLKNPKVKPPGFTDRDIANYFGKIDPLSLYETNDPGYGRSTWKSSSSSKRRRSKSSKYGSLTSTLSTWVGKKAEHNEQGRG